MRVDALWRYPVKSMLGERLEQAEVDRRGVVGDRVYAVSDGSGKLGSGKNSDRFRRIDGLRFIRADWKGAGEPALTLPDGRQADLAELREFLGADDVTLIREQAEPHFDDLPLHVVSRAELRSVAAELPEVTIDERRFRPNIVIDGSAGFLGRKAKIGTVLVEFVKATERCVMVNASEPGVERTGAVLKHLTKERRMEFGVYARVLQPGRMAVGDEVRFQ
jgi:uncharacterized protein YcbX